MKNTIIFILSTVVLLACSPNQVQKGSFLSFTPRKASVILKINDLSNFTERLNNNEFVNLLKGSSITSFLEKHEQLTSGLTPKDEVLLSYVKIGKNEYDISLTTKNHPKLRTLDSTKTNYKQVTPLIRHITTPLHSFYDTTINDIYICASSKLLIENALREQGITINPDLEKAYRAASKSTFTALVSGNYAPELHHHLLPNANGSFLKNNFSWAAIDLSLNVDGIEISGAIIPGDHNKLLNHFTATQPSKNSFQNITPNSYKSMTSIAAKEIAILQDNYYNALQNPTLKRTKFDSLIQTVDQISFVKLNEGTLLSLHSIALENTQQHLPEITKQHSFRNYTFNEVTPLDAKKLTKALRIVTLQNIKIPQIKFMVKLNEFYLLAESKKVLENSIANYQSKSMLAQNKKYTQGTQELSNSSSWQYYSKLNNFETFATKDQQKIKTRDFSAYPFLALQLNQDKGFLHLNGIIPKVNNALEAGIGQIASVQLVSGIASPPKFVKNHLNGGNDIIVQDINNVLYLISNSGKILWQKKLNHPIIGSIKQVDLFRNGRLQLAFNTSKALYVLDRNGNTVNPFPISLKQQATQELAVFDYENNRNYRFAVTQGNRIKLYNKQGNIVKGFKLAPTKSQIIHPPKHIRIANKDYIVVAEQSGKLNITNRIGKSRITVKTPISFSELPIYLEGNLFTTTDVNGKKIRIDTKGNVSKSETPLTAPFEITQKNKATVALTTNALYINNKKFKIDYGTYTPPALTVIKNNTLITTTNVDTNEVFVFDSKGNILPNYPVYGTSKADIAYLERDKTLGLVTQGDPNTILIYAAH